MPDHDDLVEKVARAIEQSLLTSQLRDAFEHPYTAEARAALAVALEQAAKECDRLGSDPRMYSSERRRGAGQCAAAIRNLIGEK